MRFQLHLLFMTCVLLVALGCGANRSSETPDATPGAESCTDGILNGGETDVDCGGGACPLCGESENCQVPEDCESSLCVVSPCEGEFCAPSTCQTTCGDIDERCCETDPRCNNSGVLCGDDDKCHACGGPNQPCCMESSCNGNLVCNQGTCNQIALKSGVSCNNDCKTPNQL